MRGMLALLLLAVALPAQELRVADGIVFRDQAAVLESAVAGPWRWRHRVLVRAGWQELPAGSAPAAARVEVATGVAGIHVLAVAEPVAGELRLLAIEPPPPLTAAALARTLPRRGAALLAGEPFTLLALGDSVTHTGWYDRILARLLERATGNRRIAVVNRSYPGRSVDAAVRNFAADTAQRPDLACIMYGLNDQAAWAPLDGYRAQVGWLVDELRARCGADVVLLQPTPDLAPVQPGGDAPPAQALRALPFAAALRPLAAQRGVALAETFAALWRARGDDLPAALASLRPCYPRAYDRQLTSLVEDDGRGDHLHPNALGHHALAQAVLAALAGVAEAEALELDATSAWRTEGLVTTLRLRNAGDRRLRGRLEVHAPTAAVVAVAGDLAYDLAPGAASTVAVAWPQVRAADDLFRHPYDRYVAAAAPLLAVLDFRDGACRARAVTGAITPAGGFVRGRQLCAEPAARVRLDTPQGPQVVTATWPATSAVGRQRLVAEVADGDRRAPLAAELVWVRLAAACSGEAVIDGDLGEWQDDAWAPLGEPCQARWLTGPEDRRAAPGEFRLEWAVRAGREALHLALRIRGDPRQDRFTVFCDPRPTDLLGSPGPYWWIAGRWAAGGTIALQRGETSPPGPLAAGRWQAVADGIAAECSIPYAALATAGWPAGGDLGFSFWWTHQGTGGTTQLLWSDDGHPWSPRGYGVVRRDPSGPLPWVVRVR